MDKVKPKGFSKSKYFLFILFMLFGRFYSSNSEVHSREENVELNFEVYSHYDDIMSANILLDESDELIHEEIVETIEVVEEPIIFETTQYSYLFEELRVRPIEYAENASNVVYLTFDDGPSAVTVKILDILDEYGIKGTFFVQGEHLNSETSIEIVKRMQSSGHAIGAHTETHIYKEIYSSVEAFLEDFYIAWNKIYEITGEKTYLYRFPGGSYNSFNKAIINDVTDEIENRGFVYYDWNVSSEDSVSAHASIETILLNATKSNGYSRCIVLMHDSAPKTNTAAALPQIIEYYINKGYSFEILTPEVKPIQF